MSEKQGDGVVIAGAVAKAVVDHLISVSSVRESDQWMAKYIAIQDALAGERFRDAVREYSRLVDFRIEVKWVVSRELAKRLNRAMGNLAREFNLPNPGKAEIRLDDLPADVTELGTIVDEQKRLLQALADSMIRDPLEEVPDSR